MGSRTLDGSAVFDRSMPWIGLGSLTRRPPPDEALSRLLDGIFLNLLFLDFGSYAQVDQYPVILHDV